MNLGSFPIAMPTPVLGEAHHQTKGAPGLVTCSNLEHRAQTKASPSSRPSPALHNPTFPSLPGCADRARPLPRLHQSAYGAAPVAQEASVRSQLAPGPLAAPRPPPPRMKAAPQLARLAQRARRGSRAGPSGERALRACLPRARSLPLRLRPGRGRGGPGGGAQGAGLLRQGRGAGRSGAR